MNASHQEEELNDAESVDSYSGDRGAGDGTYERSYDGIFEAKPNHFNAIWPSVRTESFVEKVFGSIKKLGDQATFERILDDTGLDEKTFGIAIADLMIWRKDVAVKTELDQRIYIAVKAELTKVAPEDRARFFQSKRA